MELTSASAAPGVSVEEMARMLLDIADEDEAAVRRAASVELAAFQEYASAYAVYRPVFVCKGCHGG